MPRTLQQFERLTTIHNKLATGNRYTFSELRNACASPDGRIPSERTMYDDLRRLREDYGAPIPEYDRSPRPYYYRPGEPFSLHGAFNPDDAALANEAAALLKQVSHLPQFAGLEDVFLKLEQRAGVVGRAEKSVVQYEQNPDYVGLKWLQPLYDAIRADHQVLIDYCDFKDQSFKFDVSPYLLKEYNNRWFVFGWVAGPATIYNLALDRIKAITSLPNLRRRSDDRDWVLEFADVLGATRSQEPLETLRLRIRLPRARYVETKPLHRSQDILDKTPGYYDFTYQLRWNNELVARILELGPDAELLSPPHRREELKQKVMAMATCYGKG